MVPDGRSSFEVPAGCESLGGVGDEAFVSTSAGRVSAVAFVDGDLYAADVVAEGTGAGEAELRDLCLRLLQLIVA